MVAVEQPKGGVVARFADGTEATGGLLIGAAGMRSKVRSLVDPMAPAPEFVGLVGTGGYAHNVQVSASPDTFHFAFGKRGFFGYMVVASGEVWWFANEPQASAPTSAELAAISGEKAKRRLITLFADDAIPAREIIEASAEDAGWVPLHSMAAPARWHLGRMVLVGDAGPVTSPSSGQGASLAIADAIMLARCLRDLADHGEAFTTYQRLRHDRVQKVYNSAKKVNASKAAGPTGRLLRDLLMPVFDKPVNREPTTAAA